MEAGGAAYGKEARNDEMRRWKVKESETKQGDTERWCGGDVRDRKEDWTKIISAFSVHALPHGYPAKAPTAYVYVPS